MDMKNSFGRKFFKKIFSAFKNWFFVQRMY